LGWWWKEKLMAFPDYDQLYREIVGWGWEGATYPLGAASNILVGTNPPYSATDFYRWFPNFAGTPATVTGTLDGATGVVTGVSDFTNLATGQLVAGNGIQGGTVIQSMDQTGGTLTLSLPTTATGSQSLLIYVSPIVPLAVLNSYIYLASSSILQVRYQENWSYVMALYIAHFLTLWLNGQGSGTASTGGQMAAQGMALGIAISKHVGDVSVASQALVMPAVFSSYALTVYGQMLIPFAMTAGAGPVLLW
jgi:hypothetical protein